MEVMVVDDIPGVDAATYDRALAAAGVEDESPEA